MGRLLLVVAFGALGACGNVASLRQDAAIDAPDPDALVCVGGMLACADQCSDPMTDHDHCGACDGACTDAEDCLAGHCTDDTASCAAIKQANPAAMDGPYTHKLDGTQFYCDMTHSMQYDELGIGAFNVAHTGFTQIGGADLAAPGAQHAFIWLYNYQGGATNLVLNWSGAGCCAMRGTSAANEDLGFNGTFVGPADSTTNTFSCLAAYPAATYRLSQGSAPLPDPLPDDFFSTTTVTEINVCADAGNPALFWKREAL